VRLIKKDIGNSRVIHISGEIDLYNAADMKQIIDEICPGVINIILNFHDVSYIDSSGIGSLLYIQRISAQKGIKVIFTELSEAVKNLIQLTKLTSFFKITETMAEAYAILNIKLEEASNEYV